MRGVQDALAFGKAPQFARGDDLVLAVAARHAVAEFRVHPQAVRIFGKNILQQQPLPFLRGAAGFFVQRGGLLAVRALIRQRHALRRRLAA